MQKQQGFVVCDITHFKWYQHKHFESNQGQRSTTADHFKTVGQWDIAIPQAAISEHI